MLQIILWSYFDLWPQCHKKWQSGQMATIRSSSKIVGDKPTDFIGDNMVKQKIQESSLLYLNLLWPAIWDTIFFFDHIVTILSILSFTCLKYKCRTILYDTCKWDENNHIDILKSNFKVVRTRKKFEDVLFRTNVMFMT